MTSLSTLDLTRVDFPAAELTEPVDLDIDRAALRQFSLHRLLAYGVEGKHYVVGEDGFPKLPDGITPDNAPMHFGMHPFS